MEQETRGGHGIGSPLSCGSAVTRCGGLTGNDDPFVGFYHDVPRALAEEAMSHCVALSRPEALASMLVDHSAEVRVS